MCTIGVECAAYAGFRVRTKQRAFTTAVVDGDVHNLLGNSIEPEPMESGAHWAFGVVRQPEANLHDDRFTLWGDYVLESRLYLPVRPVLTAD